MLKLYNFSSDDKQYWETWDNGDGTHTVHWGQLGTRGENKIIKRSLLNLLRHPEKIIEKQIESMMAQGYSEQSNVFVLIVEYSIAGMGTEQDLKKRHELEDRVNNLLGWTGLGECDGGSIGSGTMEVCCFVADFELAKQVIEQNLKGTEFSDYSRIYDETAES